MHKALSKRTSNFADIYVRYKDVNPAKYDSCWRAKIYPDPDRITDMSRGIAPYPSACTVYGFWLEKRAVGWSENEADFGLSRSGGQAIGPMVL